MVPEIPAESFRILNQNPAWRTGQTGRFWQGRVYPSWEVHINLRLAPRVAQV